MSFDFTFILTHFFLIFFFCACGLDVQILFHFSECIFLGSRSPMKPIFATTPTASNRSSGADMFAVDSDVDATPKVTKQPMKEQRIFNMPDID